MPTAEVPLTSRQKFEEKCKAPLAIEKVDMTEWGVDDWYVQALPGTATETIEERTSKGGNAYANWCILCVCDADRNPVFKQSDHDMILKGPAAPMVRCGQVALRLNGLAGDPSKNSPEGQAEDSPTTSPSN